MYCRFSIYSGRSHLTGATHPGNSIKACGQRAGALPSHGRHWLCVAVRLLQGCGREGVSDACGEQCPLAPSRLLCLRNLNLFLSNICENVLGIF